MATWEDVRRIALGLPETHERTDRDATLQWRVKDKLFAWERPLRRADLAELRDAAPQGDVLGVSVPDDGVKRALVADNGEVYFTTSHFDGYAAVLVRLERIQADELGELLTEAWRVRAPKRLVQAHQAVTPALRGEGPARSRR